MMARLDQMKSDLGGLGLAGLVLLAAAALFFTLAVKPLQERSRALQAALERGERGAQPGQVAGKLDELYRYLDRPEERTDWLAKLHAIGRATGVQTRSATYRTHAAGGRLERYEIVLPVSGTYAQLRDFMKRALAEIPVLSLDQMSLKREKRSEERVQAELRLTLHEVRK
jgi:Tfp pilus assembly protein PilO